MTSVKNHKKANTMCSSTFSCIFSSKRSVNTKFHPRTCTNSVSEQRPSFQIKEEKKSKLNMKHLTALLVVVVATQFSMVPGLHYSITFNPDHFSNYEQEAVAQLRMRLGNMLPANYMREDYYLTTWLQKNHFDVEKTAETLKKYLKDMADSKLDIVWEIEGTNVHDIFKYSGDVAGNRDKPVKMNPNPNVQQLSKLYAGIQKLQHRQNPDEAKNDSNSEAIPDKSALASAGLESVELKEIYILEDELSKSLDTSILPSGLIRGSPQKIETIE